MPLRSVPVHTACVLAVASSQYKYHTAGGLAVASGQYYKYHTAGVSAAASDQYQYTRLVPYCIIYWWNMT